MSPEVVVLPKSYHNTTKTVGAVTIYYIITCILVFCTEPISCFVGTYLFTKPIYYRAYLLYIGCVINRFGNVLRYFHVYLSPRYYFMCIYVSGISCVFMYPVFHVYLRIPYCKCTRIYVTRISCVFTYPVFHVYLSIPYFMCI